MKTQARRISSYEEHLQDKSEMTYWFIPDDGWYLWLPGCGLASLRGHTVVENVDGTITAQPSILTTGWDSGQRVQRHGFLTAGVWEEV